MNIATTSLVPSLSPQSLTAYYRTLFSQTHVQIHNYLPLYQINISSLHVHRISEWYFIIFLMEFFFLLLLLFLNGTQNVIIYMYVGIRMTPHSFDRGAPPRFKFCRHRRCDLGSLLLLCSFTLISCIHE